MTDTKKIQVVSARPYRPFVLWSGGDADYMLVRQHEFPCEYYSNENILINYSNYAEKWSPGYFEKCFEEVNLLNHTFEYWVKEERAENILTFLKKVMKADPNIDWTGFRIIGTVDVSGNVEFVWQLFAKDPNSDTQVYSEYNAPNVKPRH